MRYKFGKLLAELGEKDPKIVVLAGDIGYGVLDEFQGKFPDRYFNVGTAEQSMISIAAGLAISGMKPYVYTITPFIIERAFEQIKIDVDAMNLNVKMIGYADYPEQGITHRELNGKYLMKMFKNIKSYFPTKEEEVKKAMLESYKSKKPTFISLKKLK